jgi:hypothetical protein
MKSFKVLVLVAFTIILFVSCIKDNEQVVPSRPSQQEYQALVQNALESRTQEFQIEADGSWKSFTSEQGTVVAINTGCLTLNQSPVSGAVDIKFIEIFDKGSMLVTNKPTMGVTNNGDKSLLISGGEIYIELSQNNSEIEIDCDYQIIVDASLTGGEDTDMTLWEGQFNQDGNLFWEESIGQIMIEPGTGQYGVFARQFGWNNIDKFYNDPRPKTTISVKVPEGYTILNSGVNLSFDGDNLGLAQLDTFDLSTNAFSEHYGQIPIGLECHVIFLTEEDGNYKYTIKPVTIAENEQIVITDDELMVTTEEQLVQLINDLP